MAAKRKPVRMCVGCRERFFKPALTRYVSAGGSVIKDPEQKMPGRGFYVCDKAACVEKMLKRFSRR